MKTLSRMMMAAPLLVGCTMFAQADTITWTFSDVVFSDGNKVSGNFVTDTSLNVESFSVSVAGASDVWSFTADAFDGPALFNSPNAEVGFASNAFLPSDGFDPFVDLDIHGTLSGAGGTFTITDGVDCKNFNQPNCVLLDVAGQGHAPELIGTLNSTATPEPSTIPLLGLGVLGMVAMLRRKLVRVS